MEPHSRCGKCYDCIAGDLHCGIMLLCMGAAAKLEMGGMGEIEIAALIESVSVGAASAIIAAREDLARP